MRIFPQNFLFHLFNFAHKRNGNIAIIFGATLLPLVAITGAVVDFGNSYRHSNKVQNVLDAATLSAAREIQNGGSIADAKSTFKKYVSTHLSNDKGFNPKLSVSGDMETLSATLTSSIDTYVLNVIGIEQLDVKADTTVTMGGQALEVALVLDTTGSMHGEKLEALKKSAENFITTLLPEGREINVKISLIPFSRYVNIGLDNRNEEGIFVPDDYTVSEIEYKCRATYPNSTRSCKREKYVAQCKERTCLSDTYPAICETRIYNCTKERNVSCTGDRGERVDQCGYRTRSEEYSWYGCVASRPEPLNVIDDQYSDSPVQGRMAEENNCEYSEIIRLTKDRQQLMDGVRSLKANGETFIPGGLIWGWRAISNRAPFTEGAPASSKVKKAVVLMTDGVNTRSINREKNKDETKNNTVPVWNHDAKDAENANRITKTLCGNIKKEGIELYTIAFDLEDEKFKKLLEGCASSGGFYYDVPASSQLLSAFSSIASSLKGLRIAQ